MVIGYYRNNVHGLFVTDRATVTNEDTNTAVGIGAMYVQPFLSEIWRTKPLLILPTLPHAIVCASYAIFLAKEHVDGCGNFTDVVYLRNNAAAFIDRDVIENLENIFRKYTKDLELPLLRRTLGARVSTMPNAGEIAEDLRREIENCDFKLIEGLPNFDPQEAPRAPQPPRRGRKARPPSRA